MPIRLGYVSQVDSAPIVVAHETGIFALYKLDVRLSRELGWASVRDKISYGELDASQSIAGISIGLGLGLGMKRCKVLVPLVFNLHGNAITLSTEIGREQIGRGEGLQEYLDHEWKKDRPMVLAVPHRFSSHHSLLTTWLSRNGVSHTRNIEIISLPAFMMPRQLKAGHIDGYCAGEPWNSVSVMAGHGWCPATSAVIASRHPESVLLIEGGFASRNSERVIALVAALIESCRLCQDPEFREELISILARSQYIGCCPAILRNSLGPVFDSGVDQSGDTDFHIFSGGDTNRPSMDKASWVLSGLRKNHTIPDIAGGSLSMVYREDVYLSAERSLTSPEIQQSRPVVAPAIAG